jgi:hypothetical protein
MSVRQDTVDFVDGLNTAVRENPLAAALIGAGVAWMLMGGTKGLGVAAGAAKVAATKVGSAGAAAGAAVSHGAGEAASRVAAAARKAKEAASDVAGEVTSIVPDLPAMDTEKAYDAVAEAGSSVRDRLSSAAASGRAYGSTLQEKLGESFDRQPLLLGALGLAIGAGIATTFATTALESEWVGEKAAAVRESAEQLAGEAKERAQQVVSGVKEEVYAQGLTPGAAQDAVAGVADKIKTVGGAAREAVTQRLSGSSNG